VFIGGRVVEARVHLCPTHRDLAAAGAAA
jgi:hypothetical protein